MIDNGQTADSQTTTAALTDVAPTVAAMQVSDSREGETATLTGTCTDPATDDTFQLQVTWGDGQSDSEQLAEGATTFSLDHVYGDEGAYGVQVTITDNNGGVVTGTATAQVTENPPQLQGVSMTSSINEGEYAAVTGTIVDKGWKDSHQAHRHLGRRTTSTYDYAAGTTSFAEIHQYFERPARHNNLGPVRRGPDALRRRRIDGHRRHERHRERRAVGTGGCSGLFPR